MPRKARILFKINPLLHQNINIQLSLRLFPLHFNNILRLQNLIDMILINLIRPLQGQTAIHPSPLVLMMCHVFYMNIYYTF